MQEKISTTLAEITSSADAPSHVWATPYGGPQPDQPHQFVVFLKPEVTTPKLGIDGPRILELILATLEKWDVTISGTRVLRGDYLRSHRIMDLHYGVINSISHGGRTAITQQAEAKLQTEFADLLQQRARVLGGHQFLEEQPAFTPLALSTLSDNIGTTKLGGGTYALPLNVLGHHYVVLNPFHPYQLEPYYDTASGIVVFECHSSKPWAELRGQLAGATNPSKAADGSIRNQLLQRKEELRLADVSPGANGIHLSAGALEGMVEVQRFFTDHEAHAELALVQTTFGEALAASGLSETDIAALAANPDLQWPEGTSSAFDATEELDAQEAATRLVAALSAPSV